MDCADVLFSGHAVRRMFERELSKKTILEVIDRGEVIANYPNDQPYPSCLILGTVANQPIHVVVARDPESRVCFVVTAYRPKQGLWSDDFQTRR